jgi:3-hydroxyacyl-[acyl-carrier-protein] dehydratase
LRLNLKKQILLKGAENLEIKEIMEILPHRFPFLMVDKILEIEKGKRVVGIKNVTINEPFFQGHYPGFPVMPGVMIAEAIAQVGGVMMIGSLDADRYIPLLAGFENFKFRKPVMPGDQLRIEVDLVFARGTLGKIRGKALVEGKVVAEGEILFAFVKEKK